MVNYGQLSYVDEQVDDCINVKINIPETIDDGGEGVLILTSFNGTFFEPVAPRTLLTDDSSSLEDETKRFDCLGLYAGGAIDITFGSLPILTDGLIGESELELELVDLETDGDLTRDCNFGI